MCTACQPSARVADNLNAISLDQQHTLEEWVTYQLPSRRLAGLLYRSGIFQHLTSAAGAHPSPTVALAHVEADGATCRTKGDAPPPTNPE